MTAAQIIDAAVGRRKKPRDPAFPTDPVRKHSYDVNDRRAQPWRRIGTGTLQFGKAFVASLNRTAEWLFAEQYREGHVGPDRLQRSHLLVLKGMLARLDFATGRLDPSWATIAELGSCGRSTVDRAQEALGHAGFMCLVRRTVPKDGAAGQRGPQREQTSSAIYFDCKARMAPRVFAQFWAFLLEELSRFGKWLKAQIRSVLRTFNSEAVPSPREPKVTRLLKRAAKALAPPRDQAARTPVEGRLGRPDSVPAPIAPPAGKLMPAGLVDALARMAAHWGDDLGTALNAST